MNRAPGEVVLACTEVILRMLGAIPDQIDQECDRVHRDIFDKPTVAARQKALPRQSPHARET